MQPGIAGGLFNGWLEQGNGRRPVSGEFVETGLEADALEAGGQLGILQQQAGPGKIAAAQEKGNLGDGEQRTRTAMAPKGRRMGLQQANLTELQVPLGLQATAQGRSRKAIKMPLDQGLG